MIKPELAKFDDLDPDIRQFQRRTSRDYALFSADGDDSVSSRRAVAEKVRAPWVRGGPAMASTKDRTLPSGVRIRIHNPGEGAPSGVLVYLHGGGWVMFSLDTHDRLMREYAFRSGYAVVGVDYSLAPEAPYPQALDDVASVVEWIGEGGLSDTVQTSRLVIGGDSAGANLAIAATMRARDAGEKTADGLLLNYGAFDRRERLSHQRYDGDEYMLTRAEMAAFWDAYLGGADEKDARYAQPLRLDADGLPPTFMCIAACDILADENREMAAKLRASGRRVTEKVYEGATHSFLEAVSISPLASRALDDAARWLKEKAQAELD